jgi:hypothetical protein
VNPDSVQTGDAFSYTIQVSVQGSPSYLSDNQTVPAYSRYKNIALEIEVPAGIDLYQGSTRLEPVNGKVTLNNFSDLDLGAKTSFSLTGKMTGNGSVPNNTAYPELVIHATASVDTTDADNNPTSVSFSYELNEDNDRNNTLIKNEADEGWTLAKTKKSDTPEISDVGGVAYATFTYNIEVGLKNSGGAFITDPAKYDKFGAINFSDFNLTDALPTFLNAADAEVKPSSSSITLLSPSNAAGTTSDTGGADDTVLSVTGYNRTALTGLHEGTDPSASMTPSYSKYEVKVTYPLGDLTLPYGSPQEGQEGVFRLTNNASLHYRYEGKTSDEEPLTDSASIDHQETTPGGSLIIHKKISFLNESQATQDYNAYWSSVFPGPAVFGVTPDSNWSGGDSGAPLVDDADHVTNYSLAKNEDAQTLTLGPGNYWVFEKTAPANTTAASQAQSLTVASDGSYTLTFTNTTQKGLLKFRKVREGSTIALGGAKFELWKDYEQAGAEKAAEAESDSSGYVYMLVDPGMYTLVETQVPVGGYLPIENRVVTVENAETLDLGDVEDPTSKASLTVRKYVVPSDSNYPESDKILVDGNTANAPVGVNASDFSFILRRSSAIWIGLTETAIGFSTR